MSTNAFLRPTKSLGMATALVLVAFLMSVAACDSDAETSDADPADGGSNSPPAAEEGGMDPPAPPVTMDTTGGAPPPPGAGPTPGAPPQPPSETPPPGNPSPGGLPEVPPVEEKPGSRMLTLGSYQLAIPKGSAAQQRQNGTVELTRGGITAQIRPIPDLLGSSTSDLFAPIREAWNPENPLLPVGQARTAQYEHLGGSAMEQRYNQPLGGSDAYHGFFLLHVSGGSPPEGVALDVFSDGAAQTARDWEALSTYVRAVMENLRFKRPPQ